MNKPLIISCDQPLCWMTHKVGFSSQTGLSQLLRIQCRDGQNKPKTIYDFAFGISGFSLNINAYAQQFKIQPIVLSQSKTEIQIRLSLVFIGNYFSPPLNEAWVKLSVLVLSVDASDQVWLGNMQGIANGKLSPPIPLNISEGNNSQSAFLSGLDLLFPPAAAPEIQQTAVSIHASANTFPDANDTVSIHANVGMAGLNTNVSIGNHPLTTADGLIDAGMFAFRKNNAWMTQLISFGQSGEKVSGIVKQSLTFPEAIHENKVLFLLQSFAFELSPTNGLYEYKNAQIDLDIWANVKGPTAEVSFNSYFSLKNQDTPPQIKTGKASATYLAIANQTQS